MCLETISRDRQKKWRQEGPPAYRAPPFHIRSICRRLRSGFLRRAMGCPGFKKLELLLFGKPSLSSNSASLSMAVMRHFRRLAARSTVSGEGYRTSRAKRREFGGESLLDEFPISEIKERGAPHARHCYGARGPIGLRYCWRNTITQPRPVTVPYMLTTPLPHSLTPFPVKSPAGSWGACPATPLTGRKAR
jgi:hypothetical protein